MPGAPLRIPYTQQFSPAQTPLGKLLAVLRQNKGDRSDLKKAIGAAFFGGKPKPVRLANNTVISLGVYGIIDRKSDLTPFGRALIDLQNDDKAAVDALAKHILLKLDGIQVVEALREMARGGHNCSVATLTQELRHRGIKVSNNASDLSGVLDWLRLSGVLNDYSVNEERYAAVSGIHVPVIEAFKNLDATQIGFLRAMSALNITDWTPFDTVAEHAEVLYSGEVTFNWKVVPKTVLVPLKEAGLIDMQLAPKSGATTRGGKSAFVKPTAKFEKDVAEPILASLLKNVGIKDVRKIRGIKFEDLLTRLTSKDDNERGIALEILAMRICQMLDLEFMGLRETDESVAGGGEVDGLMHSARLIYSRWQIQCKATDKITLDALTKEVGMSEVTLATVILIVSTGKLTDGASTYRRKIIEKKPLNIAILDGDALAEIAKDPAAIGRILHDQAVDAMSLKPHPPLINPPHSGGPAKRRPAKPERAGAVPPENGESQPMLNLSSYYSTALGSVYTGDCVQILPHLIAKGVRAKLIFTSPPFALVRKKTYGNEDAERYVNWFMRLVPLLQQVLEPDGSFVMEIGGSWLPGLPVKSTYQFELLLRICKSGFYLAQDFYLYNPARLPTPAEWVTVRRVRVKDAVNNVWWFSPDPFPYADNRQVLREYSPSMLRLLKNGYKAKMRPSGHNISTKFQRDRGGAIPPNLLEYANTESGGRYLKACRAAGVKPHPARFPVNLAKFFINFLTKPGEVVLDPFAGSNATGEAAESLGRRWISIELEEEYVKGSMLRFEENKFTESKVVRFPKVA